MSVTVFSVSEKSAAAKKHIQKGDILHSINGNPINDVLDYDFYAADSRLTLEMTSVSGKARTIDLLLSLFRQSRPHTLSRHAISERAAGGKGLRRS